MGTRRNFLTEKRSRRSVRRRLRDETIRARLLGNAAVWLCLVLLVSLVPTDSGAQQLTVSDILKKVSETYQQLQSYQLSAELVSTITAGEMHFDQGQADTGPGKSTGGTLYASSPLPAMKSEVGLAVANPGKLNFRSKDSSSEIQVISDGITTWTYSPKKKEYTEKPVSTAPGAGQSQPQGQGGDEAAKIYENTFVNRYRNLGNYSASFTLEKDKQIKVGSEKIECYVLKAKTGKGVHEIWVDKVRFIIWHSMDSDPADAREIQSPYVIQGVPYQKTLTVDMKTANFNAKLGDALFAFSPPDKAKKVGSLAAARK